MRRGKQSLPFQVAPEDPIDRILIAADLRWGIIKTPVLFHPSASTSARAVEVEERAVLYRSDTGEKLALVPANHRPWQPSDVIDFYLSFSSFYGLALETVGYVQGGRKLWGLLNTGNVATCAPGRTASTHLLLSTSCDSALAAKAVAVCFIEPGAIAIPATSRHPAHASIARSPEFLSPDELASIGEVMCDCVALPGILAELAATKVSEDECHRAIAASFGSQGDDPEKPTSTAVRAVSDALSKTAPRGHSRSTTAADLLFALAAVSDAKDRKRKPDDVLHSTWFGAGMRRKVAALQAAIRTLRRV